MSGNVRSKTSGSGIQAKIQQFEKASAQPKAGTPTGTPPKTGGTLPSPPPKTPSQTPTGFSQIPSSTVTQQQPGTSTPLNTPPKLTSSSSLQRAPSKKKTSSTTTSSPPLGGTPSPPLPSSTPTKTPTTPTTGPPLGGTPSPPLPSSTPTKTQGTPTTSGPVSTGSTSGPVPTFGAPKLRDDSALTGYIAQGVPRGAIKSISDEGFAALGGLKAANGDPGSPHFAQLKQEIGAKADVIRAAFAAGTPNAKRGDDKLITLGKSLNEGFRATTQQSDAYKNQMTKLTDGKWDPYVEMAHTHLSQNSSEYDHCKPSSAQIRNLGEAEKVSLYKYTQEKFMPYNRDVLFTMGPGRTGPTGRAMDTNLDGICMTRTALEKLPKVAEGTTVFRGDSKAYYDSYKPGAVVTRDGFTSTAASKDAKFDGDCLLEIQTKTGRDISGCSLKPGEKEVLIPPGASFRVVSRDDSGPVLRLKLEEV